MSLILADVVGSQGDVLVLTFREHLELRKMVDYLMMRDCFFVHRNHLAPGDRHGRCQIIVRASEHPDLFTLGQVASFHLRER